MGPFSGLLGYWEGWNDGLLAWRRLREVMVLDGARRAPPARGRCAGRPADRCRHLLAGGPPPADHRRPVAGTAARRRGHRPGPQRRRQKHPAAAGARPAGADRGPRPAERPGHPFLRPRPARRPHRLPAAGRPAAGGADLHQHRPRPGCPARTGGRRRPRRRRARHDRPHADGLPDPLRHHLRPLRRAAPPGRPGPGALRQSGTAGAGRTRGRARRPGPQRAARRGGADPPRRRRRAGGDA